MFVLGNLLKPCIMFAGRPVTYIGVEPLKVASLREAEDLLANNIIGLKRLARYKH